MLVYERSSGKSNSASRQDPAIEKSSVAPALSGRLAERIGHNREYDALCDDYDRRYETVLDHGITHLTLNLRKRWLEAGFVEARRRKLEAMKVWNASTANVSIVLCSCSLY